MSCLELCLFSSLGTAVNQLTKMLPGSLEQKETLTAILVGVSGTFIGVGFVLGAIIQRQFGVYSRILAQILLVFGFIIIAADVPYWFLEDGHASHKQHAGNPTNLSLEAAESYQEFVNISSVAMQVYTRTYIIAFGCITQGGASLLIFNLSTIPELFSKNKATMNFVLQGMSTVSNVVYLVLRLTGWEMCKTFALLAVLALTIPLVATFWFCKLQFMYTEAPHSSVSSDVKDDLGSTDEQLLNPSDGVLKAKQAPQKSLAVWQKWVVLILCYMFLLSSSGSLVLFYSKFDEILSFQTSSIPKSTLRSAFAIFQAVQIFMSLMFGRIYDRVRQSASNLYVGTAIMASIGSALIIGMRLSLMFPSTAVLAFFLCTILNSYTWGFMSSFSHLFYEGCSSVGFVMSVFNTTYSLASLVLPLIVINAPQFLSTPVLWIQSLTSLLFPLGLAVLGIQGMRSDGVKVNT